MWYNENVRGFIGNINPIRYRGYYFDRETGLYYLQSRYYDPETGRFISPDSIDYLEPHNFTGMNLYAYCGNNPVMYSDMLGSAPKRISANKNMRSIWDHRNSDGSWSLYDNDRFENSSPFHEQIFAMNYSKPSFDLKSGQIGLGSLSLDFYTGGWEWKKFDLSLIDVGHAELGAEYDNGNIYISAFASIYSPSIGFELFGMEFELSAEIGAVGGALHVGTGGFTAKAAIGWGLGLRINW